MFELPRPEHVDDEAWEAVYLARVRLQRAWEFQDLPEVIGKAKELVETVAKVVMAAVDGAVADSVDYQQVVKEAQKALGRQPGDGLSGDQNLRAIARGAQSIASSLAPIRNTFGTGHGRARVPDVAEEMAAVSMESSLLWTRWALRRLGHLLADYPNDLIDAVNAGTSRTALMEKFMDAVIDQQPPEVQHRIGVSFGRQSAGGYGNATAVGVDPAIDGGFDAYPIGYRHGLLEGLLITDGGAIGLTDFYATRFVSLLGSLPLDDARAQLRHLGEMASDAPWIATWRGSADVVPADVVQALQDESKGLPRGLTSDFDQFCGRLARNSDSAPSS